MPIETWAWPIDLLALAPSSAVFRDGADSLRVGAVSAKPIACDATAASTLDVVAANWTVDGEEDGWHAPSCVRAGVHHA
jgi:hypothetical protein